MAGAMVREELAWRLVILSSSSAEKILMNIKILGIISLIFVTYSIYTYLGYNEEIRNSRYFFAIGLSLALLSNLGWLMGLRVLDSSQSIFWFSLGFDLIVTACSLYVPILLSKVKFNNFTWVLKPQNALVWQGEFFKWLKETL
jgi:hypothetical protein